MISQVVFVYGLFQYVFKYNVSIFVYSHWCSIVKIFYVQGDALGPVCMYGAVEVYFNGGDAGGL